MNLTSWEESRLLVARMLLDLEIKFRELEAELEELKGASRSTVAVIPPADGSETADTPKRSGKYTTAALIGAGGGAAVATFLEVLQWIQSLLS